MQVFNEIRIAVAIAVESGVGGVERVEAVRKLPRVGKSVAVSVGGSEIRAGHILVKVRKPVAVEVACSVASERAEVSPLPLVGQHVAVGGKAFRTRDADVDVVDAPRPSMQVEGVYRGRRPTHRKPRGDEDSIEVEVPPAVREVISACTPRPAGVVLHADGKVRDESVAVGEDRMPAAVERDDRKGVGGRVNQVAAAGHRLPDVHPDYVGMARRRMRDLHILIVLRLAAFYGKRRAP